MVCLRDLIHRLPSEQCHRASTMCQKTAKSHDQIRALVKLAWSRRSKIDSPRQSPGLYIANRWLGRVIAKESLLHLRPGSFSTFLAMLAACRFYRAFHPYRVDGMSLFDRARTLE